MACFAYGVLAHVLFLGIYVYLIGFVMDVGVPKSIDGPGVPEVLPALGINFMLLMAFGLQHSVMARPTFKRWWTRFVPEPIERSTYVMASNIVVIALLAFWQPMPHVLWNVEQPMARTGLWALAALGWVLVPLATFFINHFDLFGTRQVWMHFKGQPYTHLPFQISWLYRNVRHPLYVGWLISFWATPVMTLGHLLFAGFMLAYILVAIYFEERNLLEIHGERYAEYREQVPMLIPRVSQPESVENVPESR
jgi:protein-S-isoprenylcysteine O-methyltransferase Ste14